MTMTTALSNGSGFVAPWPLPKQPVLALAVTLLHLPVFERIHLS